MKKLRILMLSLLLIPVLATSSPALAWSPFGGVDCSGSASKSAVCQDRSTKTNPLTGSDGLLIKIADLIAIIAGIAAVIIIVIAGFRFVISGGSSENVAGARRAIIYALVGIVVIVLARSIIALVLSRL